jgi:multidrug efflux pump
VSAQGTAAAFTDRFVQRPVLAIVISLVLVLLGAYSGTRLGVKETPSVESPVVTVTTTWPGADPAIVESDVTEILERQLNGIEGLRTLSSISREQTSAITLEFNLDRDLEAAANDVRSKVSLARRDLPLDAEEPVVEKADADAQAVMYLQVSQEGRSLLDLTEMADILVRERLQTIAGVSSVQIYGEQKYAMRVEIDPQALAARGLTVQQIGAALQANNVDAPAGRIEGQSSEMSVRVDEGLRTPEAFERLIVSDAGGSPVYLGDVARVRLGAEDERSAGRADSLPAISIGVVPQANANILDIADQVYQRLPDIERDLPAGAELTVAYDRTRAVRSSLKEVVETLGLAFVLVVIVIFGFLRDVRSTLVPVVAIPVSLVGTLLFLWIADFTINVFTLFGLVLAIGMVVDDAIVVLENVYRRIEEGEPPREAALLGTRQIAFAVLATTVSLVAVFLPVIFTGGTSGRLFLEFGSTVAVSVALSALVALTLTPALCAAVLRPAGKRGWFFRGTDRVFQWMNAIFASTLRGVFRFPALVAPVVLVALLGGAIGWSWLPREFFPIEDRNVFMVLVQAPEGSGFSWMNARMHELEPDLMNAVPERKVLLTRVGAGPGGVSAAGNSGMFIFPLAPKEERERRQQDIVAGLRPVLGGVTAFQAIPVQFPTVGRGFSPPLQFVIQNADFEKLAEELPKFVQAMRQIPGLSAVNEDLRLNRPELRIRVDRDKAAAMGVSIHDLAYTMQVMTSSLELSQFKRGSRSYKVLVGVAPEFRDSPLDLQAFQVPARDGAMVPLANLVSLDEGSAASARYHYQRSPSATISANLDGITLGEGIARVQKMADETLPEGFRTALAGQSKDFADSTAGLAAVFGLAVALVYLTLVGQFDSFVDPISILLAVPIALAGAFAGLALCGMTMSFFSQVGLILLIGLVAKNGILIVEYAHQLRAQQGLDRWEAAYEAAKLRFRPILMTSVATTGGALPIALGFSSESRAPLGVTVVAGMVVATGLSLYVTPVLYAALGSFVDRFQRGRHAAAVGHQPEPVPTGK